MNADRKKIIAPMEQLNTAMKQLIRVLERADEPSAAESVGIAMSHIEEYLDDSGYYNDDDDN